jgi:hypothetical protein
MTGIGFFLYRWGGVRIETDAGSIDRWNAVLCFMFARPLFFLPRW